MATKKASPNSGEQDDSRNLEIPPATSSRYQSLLEHIPGVSYIAQCGVYGRWHYVSPQIQRFLGFTPAQWLAQPGCWAERLHPDDREAVYQQEDAIEARGGPYLYEYRLLAQDGRAIWFRDQGVVVCDSNFPLPLQHGILVDVTERRENEEKVRESEERLRMALDAAQMGTWDFDFRTNHVNWDFGPLKSFHYSPVPVARSLEETLFFIQPEDRHRLIEDFKRTRDTGYPVNAEYRIILPDGSLAWRHIYGRPELDASGKVIRVVGVGQEITASKRVEQALRATNERLQSALEAARMGSWALEIPSGHLSWDENMFKSLQIQPESFGGTVDSLRAIIHPDDLPEFDQQTSSAVVKGLPFAIEYRVLLPGGQVQWRSSCGRPVVGSDGKVTSMVGTNQNITEQKEAEEALRQSELRYRSLFESSVAGVYISNEDGKLLDCNDAFVRMLGYDSKQEMQSSDTSNLYETPGDRAEFLRHLREKKSLENFEFRLCRKDRSPIWCIEAVKLIESQSGAPALLVGTLLDITPRREAEKALQTSEERLRLALAAAQMGVWEFDPLTRRSTWDDNLFQLFGAAPGLVEPSLETILSLTHPDDREELLEKFNRNPEENPHFYHEFRVVLPDGKIRWVADQGHPTFDEAGRIVRFHGVVRDITAQRELEEQLRRSQRLESVGQLAGGVAHDFNNLLTVIRGHTELLLERGRENSALVRDAEAIQKAAERATAITHQLLAFGRKQMLQPRVMDLNRVVTDMTAMLRRLIPSNIQLFPTVHASPLWVRADESQLEQVLLNLVVNARDAMPQGGTLSISTAHVPADSTLLRGRPHLSSAPHASLKVSDTGTGMDAATQARIFEPFFTTKEVGKGTGLGLATVYGIVNQSGGAIGVNSAPDKGSQFEIFLPEVAEPLSPNLPSIVRAGSARGTETILIAEDQEAVREMVTEFLSNLGYKVLPARNGAEALHLASHFEGPIHLLVTDAIMPEMGGAALATRLAQILPAIKILYVSGYASDEQALAGVVARGEAFLQKPFTLAALVQTIRVLLD